MEKFNGYTFGIIFPLVIIIVILVLSLNFTKDNFLNKTTKLETLEIRNYEGKDLSSIYDFRENSIKGPQEIDINNYNLKVTGLVEEEKSYSYDEIINRKSYSKVITLHCVEGWSATILWEGIILRDLLKEAKPKKEANTIIFHAYDGYTTSYPIEYIMNQDKLMAYKMNNLTLIPERGFPFQLVAEDKWGYKWIKWITEIEFSNDLNYKGYWESRGYSDTGNLNESFLK
ncbi:MAG: Oxidoreductase molybdopterin binding protein [archaeon GW2011_AR13]|nr:MAG: Oxidoreductase molybdopterin binding protein [archaeon GW2011_AR13]HIG95057.1 molybdopterin-dependent oxidoreductase [Nanoarchaeota archaeon]HIH62763.1 molybdopterin-dependent oxidoreductase [Nanoarchaeota archaeon]HIJ09995.1 molybdopterin-dependent oxidoreductase [Nanoarchaeota archaeon]